MTPGAQIYCILARSPEIRKGLDELATARAVRGRTR